LSSTRLIRGSGHLVFQPAQENIVGARLIVEEELLTHFPMEEIYGKHNWPSHPSPDVAVNEWSIN
ncbi:amidohydrolase, partial [Erwinia amylovora]|nr:amidohydrolase [Erwinia amylovora]